MPVSDKRSAEIAAYQGIGVAFYLLSKGDPCYIELQDGHAVACKLGEPLHGIPKVVENLMGVVGEYVFRDLKKQRTPTSEGLQEAFKRYTKLKASEEVDAIKSNIQSSTVSADPDGWNRLKPDAQAILIENSFSFYRSQAIEVAKKIHLKDEWLSRATRLASNLLQYGKLYLELAGDELHPVFGATAESYLSPEDKQYLNKCHLPSAVA